MLPCSGSYSIREEFTHGFLDLAKSMSSLSLADLKWEYQRVGVYRSDEMRDDGLTDSLIFSECPGDTEETKSRNKTKKSACDSKDKEGTTKKFEEKKTAITP